MKLKNSILLVDDEPVICETLCAILKDEGYDVIAVRSGKEALKEAEVNAFDLALVDLKLPDMQGLDVLHQLKNVNQNLCAIIITAYPTTESAIRAIQEEAYEYITKPFDISHVKLVIRRGLEDSRLNIENKRLLENLQDEKHKLEIVLQLGQRMSAILRLDELVDFIVGNVSEILQANICSLMLFNKKTGKLYITGAKGLNQQVIKSTHVAVGEGICGWVFNVGMPLLVTDIELDNREHIKQQNLQRYHSKSFLSVPIKIKNKPIGVINLADKINQSAFSEDALKFLIIIAHYAAVAIENAKLYERIESLAVTDALTGLYNHRYFQEHLGDEMARFKRYNRPLSLIMWDIDYFKRINDGYGHLIGDSVLRNISRIILENVRKVDIVSRYGGEEFAVILPETVIDKAKVVAEKIREAVENRVFVNPQTEAAIKDVVTISGGIAECIKHIDKEEFIKRADSALYLAKSEGRNKVCIHK
ncbi:MAG: diguanylate cyclase [Candidatus Omnitrophota bacterium]